MQTNDEVARRINSYPKSLVLMAWRTWVQLSPSKTRRD